MKAVIKVTIGFFLIIAVTDQSFAQTGEDCVDVYPPGSTVHGKTLGDWGGAWWQWVTSIPNDINPVSDGTGERCGLEQGGPVFFLAGTWGDDVVRDQCVVPCGKDILVPILNVICWAPGDCEPDDMDTCRQCAIGSMDLVTSLELTVDGCAVPDLEDHRELSSEFTFTMPEDNIFTLPPPLTRKGISDGYYVMLKALPPGEHEIRFKGVTADFSTETTYRYLKVLPCDLFRRGDVEPNGELDLTDVVRALAWQFVGDVTIDCQDAADVDDDGEIALTDAIRSLNFQFTGTAEPPEPPGPFQCGPDVEDDDFPPCEYPADRCGE